MHSVSGEQPTDKEPRTSATLMFIGAESLLVQRGAESVRRDLRHLPVKNHRPGIGLSGYPDFAYRPATVWLTRRSLRRLDLVLCAPSEERFGRPVSPGTDFGEPSSDTPELYHALAVPLVREAIPDDIYGLDDTGRWRAFNNLRRSGIRQTSDAKLFASVCIEALVRPPTSRTQPAQPPTDLSFPVAA